jgi:tetratricopeptide (TPR) repeat protein
MVLAVATALTSATAVGGEDAPPPSIDEFTAKAINAAITLMNENDNAGARSKLGKLKLERLSPYERSRVEQILAGIDSAEGHYGAALGHLQQALQAGGLNAQESSQVTYNVAQLYAVQELWPQATRTLETWFRTAETPNSAAYYLLALSYYQQDDVLRALEPAQKAVELTHKPQVGWLQLLLALRLQREEYLEAADLLKQLIAADPDNKSYWVQLSSVYAHLERYQKSLAVLRVAHAAGLLADAPDIRRLADMLAMNDIPHGCATVLQEVVESERAAREAQVYEKLANCWIAAGDFDEAVAPLEQAARLAEDGALFVRLAEVHVQREDWPGAAEAIRHGIDRGGLKDVEQAYVLAGIAHFKQGDMRPALSWFSRAADSERHGELARGYIRLIQANVEQPLAAAEAHP